MFFFSNGQKLKKMVRDKKLGKTFSSLTKTNFSRFQKKLKKFDISIGHTSKICSSVN
jgi:hypothetical protein